MMVAEKEIGPRVGSIAPSLIFHDADGKPVQLSEVKSSKGVILAFVRSLGWCPFCKKQIRLLDEKADELKELGWTPASVSYDSPEVLQAFREKTSVNIILLADEDSIAIDALELRNHGVKPGGKSVGVPHPAVVFIGNNGEVREVLRHHGYQTRPSADDVVSAAKKL